MREMSEINKTTIISLKEVNIKGLFIAKTRWEIRLKKLQLWLMYNKDAEQKKIVKVQTLAMDLTQFIKVAANNINLLKRKINRQHQLRTGGKSLNIAK